MSDKDSLKLKLQTLADDEGYDKPMDLIEARHVDSVVPGICLNSDCNYSTGVEPDSRSGWCEACDTTTVISCVELFFEGACDA